MPKYDNLQVVAEILNLPHKTEMTLSGAGKNWGNPGRLRCLGTEDFFTIKNYFPREDLNPHKQIQSLPCYHYTTGEWNVYTLALMQNIVKCIAGRLPPASVL